jgi:hypothetical protein
MRNMERLRRRRLFQMNIFVILAESAMFQGILIACIDYSRRKDNQNYRHAMKCLSDVLYKCLIEC